MKSFLKTAVYKVLGQKNYLHLLYKGFVVSYNLGLLKSDHIYKYHYFSKRLVKKGDTVLDIGANLGYYTYLFKNWVGPNGKVYAVEPVEAFNKVIATKTKNNQQVEIFPFALGEEEKDIELIIPGDNKYLRTGLSHVKQDTEEHNSLEYTHIFKAKQKKGSELFSTIETIDFIKMDIEGFEQFVIPELKGIIEKHKPILQIETYGPQRTIVLNELLPLGYTAFELEDGVLKALDAIRKDTFGDLMFMQLKHITKYAHLVDQ